MTRAARGGVAGRAAAVLGTLLAAAGLWLAAAPAAQAHALLVSSSPAADSTLTRLPKTVTATFSEKIVPSLSSLQVLDSAGHVASSGPSQTTNGQLALTVAVPPLLGGVYTVHWRTVSSDDGHVTSGSFTFGVGALAYAAMSGPTPQLLSSASSATAPLVAALWVFDVGLGLTVGGCWIAAYGFPREARRPLVLAIGGAGLMLAGLALDGWAQASDDGIGLGELAATSLGLGLLVQAIPVAGAAAGTAAALYLRARPRARNHALGAALACAAATALGHVLTTHAASGSHADAELFLQWLHVASFATWIGGLAALLLSIGTEASPEKTAAVRRFSRIAGYALAVLCVSGVLRALDEVGAWHDLMTTLFGRLIVLKAALLALLGCLGAVNRYRSVPAADSNLRSLRRIGTVELGVAALALIAAATLSSSLPPALAAAAPAAPVVPHVLVYGTSADLRAGLEVSPDYAGPNRFTLRVYDAVSGRASPPGSPSTADLVFTPVGRSPGTAARIVLTRAADGSYTAVGDDQLSSIGRWRVTADLRYSGRQVSIPFSLTCAPTPAQLEEMTMGRMAMVYGIQLADGLQLEAYLTPGRPGPETLHLVFTDQRGAPVLLGSAPNATFHPDGSTTTPHDLALRPVGAGALFEGQYFGTAVFAAGRWDFHVTAQADGRELGADFVLSLG